MAKIINNFIILVVILLMQAQWALAEAKSEFPAEVADPQAVDALKKYWNAFESYEYNLLRDGEKRFNDAWLQVKKSYQRERAKISASELASLQKSAATYRSHLTSHVNVESRPYVMLNLAQILSLIGDHQSSEDPDAGTFARSESLALLNDLDTNYRTFTYREQAMYLRATVFAAMGRDDEALAVWQSLAATAQTTIYGVHARIAVGDYMFKREKPLEAMRAYQKALTLLPSVNAEDPEYERVRLDYRLGWAAYRAAELEVAISAASDLLTPSIHTGSAEQKRQIQRDAIELIGDSLYEQNVSEKTFATLRRRELNDYIGAIGLRTVKRYYANAIYAQAAELGDYLVQEVPMARERPEILQVTADAWSKLGNPARRLQDLENLASLLPTQSLWRARYKTDLIAIHSMEDASRKAVELVAAQNYDIGLASGNSKVFIAAASFYEMLLDFAPNDSSANEWRLRRAHCAYFSENIEEAAKLYSALKTDFKVDSETLQIASYQLVLTNEKRWREAFSKAISHNDDSYKDAATLVALGDLEKSIDEFSARFAGQSRAVDLLLVGASSNRDMNRMAEASRFWQRVLVSQPSPPQRGIAVRGLILTALKIGSPAEVVDASRRYLKLEDWSALGLTIATELTGVLSTATIEQGKILVGTGKMTEAGELMVGIAEEFPKLPERDRIYRDGAYHLAIGGDWSAAQKSAENYLSAGLPMYRGDMLYLLARSQEYQLRLHDAAKSYADLAGKFATHPRALTSAVRAERLALAEGDFALAARAAMMQAERSASEKQRRGNYTRAADHLDKDGNPSRALQIARKGQRASRTAAERFVAQLQVARLTFKSGSEQEALDDLTVLAKQIDKNAAKMSAQEFAALSGEAHVMLGDEARRQFDDFHIVERGGDISANVDKKSEYFANLVTEYDRAAAPGDPRWASEARFYIGAAAETLSNEIAAIPNRSGESVTLKSQSRYNATILRLQALSRKYFSANVLAARKNPSQYRDNEWTNKSTMRLSGAATSDEITRHKDIMPTATQNNIPSDWSL